MHWYWILLIGLAIGYFGSDFVNYYVKLNILDKLIDIGKFIGGLFGKKAAA